jgi:predicted nicotinamide N-methyase
VEAGRPALVSVSHLGMTIQLLKCSVVWKITPLFAEWAITSANLLFEHHILTSSSVVLELGCGISGIIGLALSPLIKSYVLTDQNYVLKLLNQNLLENEHVHSSSSKGRKNTAKSKRGTDSTNMVQPASNIIARELDWEVDEVTPSLTMSESDRSFDAIIACDCIYNDSLIEPLVQTCIDSCKLRQSDPSYDSNKPTICIVAQQLRSPEVFEGWLKAFHKAFVVWRIPDEEMIEGLKSDSGFVVHIGKLR